MSKKWWKDSLGILYEPGIWSNWLTVYNNLKLESVQENEMYFLGFLKYKRNTQTKPKD